MIIVISNSNSKGLKRGKAAIQAVKTACNEQDH